MQDRTPLYPGRVKLVPVEGHTNVYDMTREDSPTQPGTPLSKATFLKDATAALYGLGADAVPDDVLAWIGKYNQYWWRRTEISYTIETATTATANLFFNWTNNYSNVISYSDSVSVDDSGKAVLVNPSTLKTSNSGSGWTSTVLGKYVTGCKVNGTSGTKTDDVYFVPSSATFSYNSSYSSYYTNSALLVTAKESRGDTSYVTSGERNAYPDSGISGGYEYQYCGIPFNNAVEATVKIATGSYTGTGTYGSSNPNSLTFDFPVKVLFVANGGNGERYNVVGDNADYMLGSIVELWGESFTRYAGIGSISNSYGRKTNNGKTPEWYSTADALSQFNESGKTYRYFAIG